MLTGEFCRLFDQIQILSIFSVLWLAVRVTLYCYEVDDIARGGGGKLGYGASVICFDLRQACHPRLLLLSARY